MRDNIVRVAIYPNRDVVTAAPIYQPDYGLKLLITNVELPTAYSVYFANSPNQGSAKRAIGDANGVEIPTEFISTGKTVYAWLFLHTGQDDGEVVYRIIIPMVGTPEFTDELPTPEQQNAIDQAITALNAAVDQTASDVEEAARQAGLAADSAEDASESAYSAAQSEAEAAQSAADALQSKQEAETAQSRAEEARDIAEGYKAEAEQSAQHAEQSAHDAAQSAAVSGYMYFHIGEDGHLYLEKTPNVNVDFYLGSDGHLYIEEAA